MSRLPGVESTKAMQMAVVLEILEMARRLVREEDKTLEEAVKTLTDLYIETWGALRETGD